MAGGHPVDTPFLGRPIEHGPEFHGPVTAGTGQRREPRAIALHQKLHDLLLEICPRIHHVVGHPQLLTQTGRIHQPFCAASALATHQPKGEPLHLPAGGAEEGRRKGTVHPTGKAHGNALLPWPGPQALQHLLHCRRNSHCRSNSRNRSRRSRKGQGASHSFMLPVQLDQPRRSRWPGPPPTPSTS